MNMSDVEGSADQDCRVHHQSGGNQEVRRSHDNFWQVNQIEEVTPDWAKFWDLRFEWYANNQTKFPPSVVMKLDVEGRWLVYMMRLCAQTAK